MKKSRTQSGKSKFIMVVDKIPTKLVVMPMYPFDYMQTKHNLPIEVPVNLTKIVLGNVVSIKREEALKIAKKEVDKIVTNLLKDKQVDSSRFWIMEKFKNTSRKIQLI